jgi:hypothetical protein
MLAATGWAQHHGYCGRFARNNLKDMKRTYG